MKDIVTQLRTNSECLAPSIMLAAADEIERVRAERDEARRMYCVMRDGEDGLNCKEWANRKNWDCFKENTNV